MKISCLSFIFFCTLTIYSQNNFGVFAGVSNTTLTDGFFRQVNIEKAFTFHVGGLYEHTFNKTISFRPKLVLSLQGDIEKTKDSPFFTGQIDYKLTYLNVPLDFKFFSKPYIIIGPQIGLLLFTNKSERDYGDLDSNFDYGLNFGVGYEFKNIFIEANAYQGINTILSLDSPSNSKLSITNTVLQLSLGYNFI